MGSFAAMVDQMLADAVAADEAKASEADEIMEAMEVVNDSMTERAAERQGFVVTTDEGAVAIAETGALAQAAQDSDKAQDEAAMIAAFAMPQPVDYRSRGERYQLIFDGVCTHCAHCGQPLTDSESIERGIGPVCSKKGYLEDPKQADEMGGIIALAEFPDLADYVAKVYKPQGARKMMNFLVKICALNRRSPVHLACTDAIEALGYKQLASTLRESVAVIEVKPRKDDPDNFLVWVKRSEWHWDWTNALRTLPGTRFPGRYSGEKGTIVPKRHKSALWDMMNRYYAGFCAKVPTKDGAGMRVIRIRKESIEETRASEPPAAPDTTSTT